MMRVTSCVSSVVAILAFAAAGQAQTLSGQALVKALQHGGYVIVMRHASSPREVPAGKTERQLDQTGRDSAAAMGRALRRLKIPIGEVYTSPAYRARETARLAGLPDPKPVPELGDNGRSMQGGTKEQAEWLRKEVTGFPTGTNMVLVTHLPNLTGAFPDLAQGTSDGEALIFGPGGKGPDGKRRAKLVARVRIEDWPKL